MEKELHLFDLDHTLWIMDTKLAVIDKRNPKDVIYRIPLEEKIFMKSNYKEDGLKIEYNGETWYLKKQIWEDIKKNNNIELENLGISYREFTDDEYLKEQLNKTQFLLNNVNHLKNKINVEIGFLTARKNKKNHKQILESLVDKIWRKLRITPKKIYFLDDINNDDDISFRKACIVLEFMTGFKIKGSRFSSLKQEKYKSVHFYDDSKENIEMVNNIQYLMEDLLIKTDVDIKKEILNNLDERNFSTYKVTENKVEPFIVNNNKLIKPRIKLFEKFIKDSF